MNAKIILTSKEHKRKAELLLSGLPLEPVHEFVLREHKKNRSAHQNSLYWLWMTVIGSELGNSKESQATEYKSMFLVQIYERDDPDEYGAMIETLRGLHRKGMKVESLALRKHIVSLTSTTTATVGQFAEYLTAIENHAASLGITLPHPEDSYLEALRRE